MDKMALAKRKVEIKEYVVSTFAERAKEFSWFQSWQPRRSAWLRAMEEAYGRHQPTHRRCITHCLKFPDDYQFAALVLASSLTDVFRCTNVNDDGDECENRIVWLRPDVSSGSVGHVFVTSNGVAHYVEPFGFRQVVDARSN